MVKVRVPGKRSAQEVPEEERQQSLAQANDRMNSGGGGSASTTHTHETYRLIWTQGCKELGIPAEDWFKFDTEVFRRMAAWSLISIQLGKLDIFTTMLNKERQFLFKDYSDPWKKHPEIVRIKKKYSMEKHQDNLAEQARVAANPDLEVELKPRLRVSIPGDTIEEIVIEGAQLISDRSAESTVKLGHISSMLLTLLFAVRASTIGGMMSNDDIWFDDRGRLCMTIRFVKYWVMGRQESTGKQLPLHRVGRDSIPPGDNAEHPRSRAMAILAEAKRRQSLMWIPGNFQERTESASKEISDMMKGYGWNRVDEGHQATSHSGRKTCVSAIDACTEGRERSALKEWMLVTDEILVTRYCERDYEMTEFTSALYDWF
jgi:hypothetical protein